MQIFLPRDSDKDSGYTLIDTIIAVIILLIAISSSISGLSLAYKTVADQKIRIIELINEKNIKHAEYQNIFEKQ